MATGTKERADSHRNGLAPPIAMPPTVAKREGQAPPGAPRDGSEMLRLRRALPALFVLMVAAALALLGAHQGNIAAPSADVTALPSTLGTWTMLASEKTDPQHWALRPGELKGLSLNSYTQRVYQDAATGRQVALLLEYRTLDRGAFNHRPEACYPASGWSLSDRKMTPITYDGRPATGVAWTADYQGHLGADHQVVLYFFANGSRAESSFLKQQVEMALGRLQPQKNGWAFLRLISECPKGDEPAALEAEKGFVKQASPEIVRVITTAVHR